MRTASGLRSRPAISRQIVWPCSICRRCKISHWPIDRQSQRSRLRTIQGTAVAAEVNAQPMPSPVNGSTYPAASPSNTIRSAESRRGCCVKGSVPNQHRCRRRRAIRGRLQRESPRQPPAHCPPHARPPNRRPRPNCRARPTCEPIRHTRSAKPPYRSCPREMWPASGRSSARARSARRRRFGMQTREVAASSDAQVHRRPQPPAQRGPWVRLSRLTSLATGRQQHLPSAPRIALGCNHRLRRRQKSRSGANRGVHQCRVERRSLDWHPARDGNARFVPSGQDRQLRERLAVRLADARVPSRLRAAPKLRGH